MGAGPREHPFVFVIREEFLMTSGCFLWGWGRTGGGRKHRGLPQIGDAVCLSPLLDHTGKDFTQVTIFSNLPKMAGQDDVF